jgi:hypothetical protein
MEKWTGKFAFLIYDRLLDKFYASNGKTADLYITYLVSIKVVKDAEGKEVEESTKLGYILNTGRLSLVDTLPVIEGIMQIFGMNLVFTVPSELKDNSTFLLEDTDIVKVGDVVENTKVVPVKPGTSINGIIEGGVHYFPKTPTGYASPGTDPLKMIAQLGKDIQDFLTGAGMDYSDLDDMCLVLYGIPYLGMDSTQLREFRDKVIPYFKKRTFPKITNVWKEITSITDGAKFLEQNQLDFPYFLNSVKSLKYLLRNLKQVKGDKVGI